MRPTGLPVAIVQRAGETRLFDSALALASRLFVAVIPVALLVSSFLPGGRTFGQRLVGGLGLTGEGRIAAERLFAAPGVVQAGMTAATCFVAVWSLVSCGGVLQRTYRAAWRINARGSDTWRAAARYRLIWAAGLVVYVGVTFELADAASRGLPATARDLTRLGLAIVFYAWSPYVLLGRQIAARQLIPPASITALAMGVLTVCAPLYVPHVASASARSYGLVGFAFALITWLFVQALVMLACAVAGAVFGERMPRTGRLSPGQAHRRHGRADRLDDRRAQRRQDDAAELARRGRSAGYAFDRPDDQPRADRR
jgi:membrane protein